MTADAPGTPPPGPPKPTTPASAARHDLTVPTQTSRPISPTRALVDTGGRFMTSPQMDSAAETFGMKSGALYFRGRTAVLGTVTAEVATATLAIYPGSLIALVWERSAAVPASEALSSYTDACIGWGREHFADFDGARRLGELATRVVDACDASSLVLFAAWQAQPRPDDDAGHAAYAVMLLRELRGGLHFAALRAHGLDIPVAVLADPAGGVPRLRRTGWRPEQIAALETRASAVHDLVSRWMAAEAMTDAAYEGAVSVLPPAERAELDDLLLRAEAASR